MKNNFTSENIIFRGNSIWRCRSDKFPCTWSQKLLYRLELSNLCNRFSWNVVKSKKQLHALRTMFYKIFSSNNFGKASHDPKTFNCCNFVWKISRRAPCCTRNTFEQLRRILDKCQECNSIECIAFLSLSRRAISNNPNWKFQSLNEEEQREAFVIICTTLMFCSSS